MAAEAADDRRRRPARRRAGLGGDLGPGFWDALRPSWRGRLVAARDAAPPVDAAAALDRLRRAHRDEARPDLGRVHPSWWVRALQGETPAVRLAVVSGFPPAVREPLRAALGLPPTASRGDRPPAPRGPPLRPGALGRAARRPSARPGGRPSRRRRPDAPRPPRPSPAWSRRSAWPSGPWRARSPPSSRPATATGSTTSGRPSGRPDPEHERLARRDVAEHGRDGRPEEGRSAWSRSPGSWRPPSPTWRAGPCSTCPTRSPGSRGR